MAEKIEALGAQCWLDEKDLTGGDSVKSQWVPFEIGGARAQHKRVTPILNNVRPQQMAPMQDIKGIDLNSFDRFLAQLRRRISQAQRKKG